MPPEGKTNRNVLSSVPVGLEAVNSSPSTLNNLSAELNPPEAVIEVSRVELMSAQPKPNPPCYSRTFIMGEISFNAGIGDLLIPKLIARYVGIQIVIVDAAIN